jgi:hypothetical protein
MPDPALRHWTTKMPPREPIDRRRVALRKSWNIQPNFNAWLEKAAHYTQRFAVLQGM